MGYLGQQLLEKGVMRGEQVGERGGAEGRLGGSGEQLQLEGGEQLVEGREEEEGPLSQSQ